MEQPDNSVLSSFIGSNIRFEKNRKRLIYLQCNRTLSCLMEIKGKVEGRDAWHFVLVDWDKKEEFFEMSGKETLDGRYYGKILASGWGCDIPEAVNKETQEYIKDLATKLFIFKLQEDKEIYYVLCDADKKSEIADTMTIDEIRRRGRILYSSMDEDPPEALWDVIERGYFGQTKRSSFVIITENGVRNYRRGIDVARGGDPQKVRDFLMEVGNVDWTDGDGWTMLHHAAHRGDLNMIRILKNMNADTQVRDDICGRKPIHIAARECYVGAIELFLINNGSVNDVDRSGWTPLHYAAWKGGSDTVKYLIAKNAMTEIKDRCSGKNPMLVAATEGHTHIVRIFLDNGANIDVADAEGRTLLFHSAFAGRFETVKFLIDGGASLNISNKFGVAPLHVSAEHDQAQVLELLLTHGADIECRNSTGETILHWAADGGCLKVVEMLVEKGASLTAIDSQGKTPLDKAIANQHLEKASYLAEKMVEMFKNNNKYSDAVEIYKRLFKIQKDTLSQDHHKMLETQINIALTFYEMNKYEEALETLNAILNKSQDDLVPYNFDILCAKYEKGRVYVAQWKLAEAMVIFKEVYKSWKDTLGAGHHRTLGVAREIGFVYFYKCEFDKALKICEDIFEKRKLFSGVDDPVTLQALQDVAIVLINKGDNENALRVLKDVFSKRKAILGADHRDTILASYHIATVEKRLESTTSERRCCLQ